MIAAIYARKSTEQFVAHDQKSVTRQIAHARAIAKDHDWLVDDADVFVDDGISVAEAGCIMTAMLDGSDVDGDHHVGVDAPHHATA